MKYKKSENLNGIILGFIIFILIIFFFRPIYEIKLFTSLPSGLEYKIDYVGQLSGLPQLNSYDIMQETSHITEQHYLLLHHVPAITDEIWIYASNSSQLLEVSAIEITLFDIPIKTISSNNLMEHTVSDIGSCALNLYNLKLGYTTSCSIILILLFCLLVGIIISKFCILRKESLAALLSILSPATIFIAIELLEHGFWFINIKYRLLNYAILLLIGLAINIIIPRFAAIILETVTILGLGIANYYVLLYRGKPLLAWDFSAISTALNVIDGYQFRFTIPMLFSIVIVTVEICFLYYLQQSSALKSKWSKRLLLLPITLVLALGLFSSNLFTNLLHHYWDLDIVYCYRIQGSVASFCKYAFGNHISKPDGYSEEALQQIGNYIDKEISKDDDEQAEIQPQNIIMVMNESFTNFHQFNNQEETNKLPYFESLFPESVYGNLYVSVRGGGTCNTEFEALTGNSLTFFPIGSVPFQSFVKEDINSIARELKKNGFNVFALHLEQEQNWNRNVVYPRLGFDTFLDINDFQEVDTIRQRATDYDNYQKVIDLYEKNKNERFFCFNITIQNHGGYDDFQDLPQTTDLHISDDGKQGEVFLSLMEMSDNALKMLIEYFDEIEEPTMIIVFGDHQPQLNEASEAVLFGDSENEFEKYITPFLIWKNYDSTSRYIEKMSANYLPSLIMEEANLPMPQFFQFLLKLYEKYPVITTPEIIDSRNNIYKDKGELYDDDMFRLYEMWEYKNIFDPEF